MNVDDAASPFKLGSPAAELFFLPSRFPEAVRSVLHAHHGSAIRICKAKFADAMRKAGL